MIKPQEIPKPISILTTLATKHDGTIGPPLDLVELTEYLRKHLATEGERLRNERHARRDDLYRDGGLHFMTTVIDTVFKDDRVRDLRKEWIPHARFNNALKRIVNELSTVYAEPAVRSVKGENDQATYEQLLDDLQIDEEMLQVSRLLNLHRAMLVGFRVRQHPDGTREPVIDIASPADVRVLVHPTDNKLPIAWLIRADHKVSARKFGLIGEASDVPVWTLWSGFEKIQLRDDLSVIPGTYKEHGLGVNPWVAITLGPIAAGFWPGEEGEDLVAAHVAIWVTNILLLKETKSATKQAVIKGDGSNTARGQASDSEVPAELADGQSMTTVDMSMDLKLFLNTADHILETGAQNYGMSAALINHQGVQSAEARELMRMPLREIRKHQQIPLRRFEQRFVQVMAQVLKVDLEERAFDPAGWRIVFGEFQTPMSKIDELNVFLAARQAGTDDTIAFIARTTGKDEDEAQAEMLAHIAVETMRNEAMRPMEAISGGPGQPMPGSQNAQVHAKPGQPINLDATGAPIDKLGMPQQTGSPTFVSPTVNSGPVPEVRQRGSGTGLIKGG